MSYCMVLVTCEKEIDARNLAEKLLEEDPRLAREFKKKKEEDETFAGNAYSQLRFIYERSPWAEPTYMRYPVYRLFD